MFDKLYFYHIIRKCSFAHNPQFTKRKMKSTIYLCDQCSIPIVNPEDGFVIQGNIYVANPQCRGGLIGNNFPKAINGRIQIDQINEVVYCKKCFFEILETNHGDLKPIISQQQRELS